MKSILHKQLYIMFLAFVLNAVAAPTWAVVDITFCDEITQPGSYRVTQDLSCQSCNQCLLIDANNVTIDLQGHTITGTFGAEGITVSPNPTLSNIEIRNGAVTSFAMGINLRKTRQARVERMRVFGNENAGIVVEGGGAVVAGNIAARNGEFGIFVGTRDGSGGTAMVIDDTASEHADGIVVLGTGNIIRNNITNKNGISGISADCPSLITENTTVGNGRENLRLAGAGCRVGNNLAPGPVR